MLKLYTKINNLHTKEVQRLLTTIWHDWSNAAECYDVLHVGAWVPCNAYSSLVESAVSIALKEKGVY